MKKNCINKYTLHSLVLLLALTITACKQRQKEKNTAPAAHQQHGSQATQSMQHGGVVDTNVAHLVKPVSEQVVSSIPVLTPSKSKRIFTVSVQGVVTYDTRQTTSLASRVSGRLEKLFITYNYQPVQKGQLIMKIYSPELMAAQRELIYLARTYAGDDLIQAAKQRLYLLGLGESLVQEIIKTGNPMYSIPVYANTSGYILEQSAAAAIPASATTNAAQGGTDQMSSMSGSAPSSNAAAAPPAAPVTKALTLREGQYVTAGQTIFTIYNNQALVADFSFASSLAAAVNKGKQLLYYASSDHNNTYLGNIGLVRPVFNAGQNFTQARVYNVSKNLKAGQQLTAELAISSSGTHYWLPQEAVLDLGNNKTVLFKKEGNTFTPVYIKTGIKADGHIEVLDEIGNWQIASNAYYMVDSEGFIPKTTK